MQAGVVVRKTSTGRGCALCAEGFQDRAIVTDAVEGGCALGEPTDQTVAMLPKTQLKN